MDIRINTLAGKPITFKGLCEKTTTMQVKQLVYEREGVPVDQIQLVFAGRYLADDNAIV
jgi:hypothetical protein